MVLPVVLGGIIFSVLDNVTRVRWVDEFLRAIKLRSNPSFFGG
jgi:hypothetical protein